MDELEEYIEVIEKCGIPVNKYMLETNFSLKDMLCCIDVVFDQDEEYILNVSEKLKGYDKYNTMDRTFFKLKTLSIYSKYLNLGNSCY